MIKNNFPNDKSSSEWILLFERLFLDLYTVYVRKCVAETKEI